MHSDKPICALDEIMEGESRGFVVAERSLFVVNKQGKLYAWYNRCPHRGVELNWVPHQFLDAGGELIQCTMHGALFLIDSGLCVAGPCHGEHLQRVALVIRDNDVYVELDAPAPATAQPS